MASSFTKVLGVRLPGEGMGSDVLGSVTFGYTRTEFDEPVKGTRYVKPPEGSAPGTQGKTYNVVDCVDGTKFKFYDVIVRKGEKGPYLSGFNFNVPREVQFAVAREAEAELNKAAAKAQASADAPQDDCPF